MTDPASTLQGLSQPGVEHSFIPPTEWDPHARFNFSYPDWFDLTFESVETPDPTTQPVPPISSEPQVGVPHIAATWSNSEQPDLFPVLNYPNIDLSTCLSPTNRMQTQHELETAGQTRMVQYPQPSAEIMQPPPLLQQFQSNEQLRSLKTSKKINNILEGFMQILSRETLPPLTKLDTQVHLSYNLLVQFLDLYRIHFQPILPVIHLPSWNLTTVPTILISAMGCIGAGFASDVEASPLSKGLGLMCSMGLLSVVSTACLFLTWYAKHSQQSSGGTRYAWPQPSLAPNSSLSLSDSRPGIGRSRYLRCCRVKKRSAGIACSTTGSF